MRLIQLMPTGPVMEMAIVGDLPGTKAGVRSTGQMGVN